MIVGKHIGNIRFELGMGYYVHSLNPDGNGFFVHVQKRFDSAKEADTESEWATTIPKSRIIKSKSN